MFVVLRRWVSLDEERRLETAKALASHIDLVCINPEHLVHVVKKSSFMDATRVDAALMEIEEIQSNLSPEEQEHVLVEGAGRSCVDGLYVRKEEELGLGSDEFLFIKESADNYGDDSCPDYSLYLYQSTWSIAPSFDPSNVLYSCRTAGPPSSHPPSQGWKTVEGDLPAPDCTWKSPKFRKSARKERYVAPNLASSFNNSLSDLWGDHGDSTHSLMVMMNLPTDEGHKDNDYHDAPGVHGDGVRESRNIVKYASDPGLGNQKHACSASS